MLVTAFVGCTKNGNGDNSADVTTTQDNVTESGPVEDIYSSLPTGSYNDYTFNILNVPVSWTDYEGQYVENMTGEPVNDAIYKRNLQAETLLGVVINEYMATNATEAKQLIEAQAGANFTESEAYDMYSTEAASAMALASQGQLTDLESATEFDFSKPWWDSAFNESIRISDHTFVAFGDANIVYGGGTFCLAYNPDMVTNFQLVDPISLYREKKWTFGTMFDMMQTVASDTTGDGITLNDDYFGLVGHSNQIKHLVMGADTALATLVDGKYRLNVNNERYITAYSEVMKKFVNNEYVAWAKITPGYDEWNKMHTVSGYAQIFNESRSLFIMDVMSAFKDNRDAEALYKMIELPMMNTSQKDYISVRYAGVRGVSIISGFDEDQLSRTATVIENLAAYAHKEVIPAFIEITLCSKYAKEPESYDMLQTMLNRTGYCDLGILYNWGTMNSMIETMQIAGRAEIGPTLTALETSFNKSVDNMLDSLDGK